MSLRNKKLSQFLQRIQLVYDKNPEARKALDKLESHLSAKQASLAFLEAEKLAEALIMEN